MKKSVLFGLTATCALVLSACSGGSNDTSTNDSGTSSSGSSELAATQELNYVEGSAIPTADLSVATNAVSFRALNAVYEGIYRVNDEQVVEPAGAAEMATVSDDGLTYTIHLNEDAVWSNGDPVTAADYVYGWQRTVDPATASQYAYLYAPVAGANDIMEGNADVSTLGIVADGEYDLTITLDVATPYFDFLLAFPSFFPQHQATVEQYGADYALTSDNAVYNGPFTLTDFDGPGTDTEWSYTKNDTYWDADSVTLDKVNVSVVTEVATALNLFQDGQADYVTLSGELAQQMSSDPQFVTVAQGTTAYLEMNQREEDSVWHNENLRKAISYAIDRESFVTNILANGSVSAPGIVPSALAVGPDGNDFTEDTDVDGFEYDPEQAAQYWETAKEELGIDSLNFDILSDDGDAAKRSLEYLQGAIEDALDGVTVTVTNVPFSVRLDRSTNGEFDMVVSLWGADYADPSSFLDLFVTGNSYNRGQWSNTEYDALIEAAATTNANDPEARWQNMLDAENIMSDQLGVIPFYQRSLATMQRSTMQGVVQHASGVDTDFKWAYMAAE
ncbi:peptide ABC transporter substrate-binding protein [Enterococcus sp. LJL90]